MARFIQEMVKKHNLMAQPLNVVNKAGNSGAEGLLDVKAAQGNPHKLIITLSNLFTTPMATGTKFTWQDITPVQMLALDQFVLWVNAKSPYQSPKDAPAPCAAPRRAASSWAAPAASRKIS
jgi:putative tricarboxylic transport membrane protein